MIFYKEFFILDFYKKKIILTTDRKSADIQISLNICWFRYWAAYAR